MPRIHSASQIRRPHAAGRAASENSLAWQSRPVARLPGTECGRAPPGYSAIAAAADSPEAELLGRCGPQRCSKLLT